MTMTLLYQALLAPLVVLGLAAFARAWYPLILVVGFWIISLWVKGTTIQAMDSVAIAFTLAAANSMLIGKVKAPVRMIAAAILLVALSVWQVKNFASSISVMAWVIQFAFLAVAIVLPELKWTTADSEKKFFNRFDVAALFWLVPVGAVAFMSPLAGSIIVGQIAGLVATLVFGVWFYNAKSQASVHQLAVLVATPALFIAQMGWHYVEISWTSIALAIIGWLPVLWPGLKKQAWWLQLILVIVFFAAILGTQLYLEWPEGSLY